MEEEEEEERPKAGIPGYPNTGHSRSNLLCNLWVTRARTFSSGEGRTRAPCLMLRRKYSYLRGSFISEGKFQVNK